MEEQKIEKLKVDEFEDVPGYGIIGKIQNRQIILGNNKIVEKYNIKNTRLEDEKELAQSGNSIIYVIENQEIIALIGVNDIVRKNAKEVIKQLNDKHIQTIMLTGDNKQTAEKIATELGISKVISNVLPAEKADMIKQLNKKKIM